MKHLITAAVSIAAIYGMAAPVNAAPSGCSCATALPSSGPAGTVISAKGDVVISGPAAYSPAKKGMSIAANSEVMASQGSAVVKIGSNCTVNVQPNSSVNIADAGNGQLCVMQSAVSDTGSTTADYTPDSGAGVPNGPGGAGTPGGPGFAGSPGGLGGLGGLPAGGWVALAGAAAVGVGVAVDANNDDNNSDDRRLLGRPPVSE